MTAQQFYEVWVKEHGDDPRGDWPIQFAEAFAKHLAGHAEPSSQAGEPPRERNGNAPVSRYLTEVEAGEPPQWIRESKPQPTLTMATGIANDLLGKDAPQGALQLLIARLESWREAIVGQTLLYRSQQAGEPERCPTCHSNWKSVPWCIVKHRHGFDAIPACEWCADSWHSSSQAQAGTMTPKGSLSIPCNEPTRGCDAPISSPEAQAGTAGTPRPKMKFGDWCDMNVIQPTMGNVDLYVCAMLAKARSEGAEAMRERIKLLVRFRAFGNDGSELNLDSTVTRGELLEALEALSLEMPDTPSNLNSSSK